MRSATVGSVASAIALGPHNGTRPTAHGAGSVSSDNKRPRAAAPARCIAPRTAISTASRSTVPVLRHPVKITCSSWLTSWWTSCWIACAVFFLRRQSFLYRPHPADLFVHLQERTAHFLIPAKLGHFPLGFALSGGARKTFRDGLPSDLVGEPQVRPMARILFVMAVAVRIIAAPSGAGDGTATQIAQFAEFRDQIVAMGFQSPYPLTPATTELTLCYVF